MQTRNRFVWSVNWRFGGLVIKVLSVIVSWIWIWPMNFWLMSFNLKISWILLLLLQESKCEMKLHRNCLTSGISLDCHGSQKKIGSDYKDKLDSFQKILFGSGSKSNFKNESFFNLRSSVIGGKKFEFLFVFLNFICIRMVILYSEHFL